MREHGCEIALALHAELGEGPVWDERAQRLHFVDILGKNVHSFAPATGEHTSFDAGRVVGCVVLREDGGFVLAAHDGFFLASPDGTDVVPFGDLKADGEVVRFNDGKVGPGGWLVAGTMDWGKKEPLGSLYLLKGDGSASVLLEDVTISNGLAWDAQGTTMYYIDTPRHQVEAFAFDPATGTISDRRLVAELPDVSPDGMAMDDEGTLWVACWGGSRVQRIDPGNGRMLDVVRVPTSHVTSVAFGGPQMDELYITTARDDLTPEKLAAEPHAGNLFVARPGVSGPPANRFKLRSAA